MGAYGASELEAELPPASSCDEELSDDEEDDEAEGSASLMVLAWSVLLLFSFFFFSFFFLVTLLRAPMTPHFHSTAKNSRANSVVDSDTITVVTTGSKEAGGEVGAVAFKRGSEIEEAGGGSLGQGSGKPIRDCESP